MLSDLWDFLGDPKNRAVLGWVGGGPRGGSLLPLG
jgi:hypothetical protein